MRYGFLIVSTLCLFLLTDSQAQPKKTTLSKPNYIFRTIDNSNGLLSNYVRVITQDHRGFIWIGDKKYLQRYDGSRFTNYFDSIDIPGESNPPISLYPDNNNNCIWIIKHGFPARQLQLLRNEFTGPDTETIKNNTGDEYRDWDGLTWALHRNNIPHNILQGKTTGHLLLSDPIEKRTYFTKFITDSIGHAIWVLSNKYGWLLFDDKTRKVYSQQHNAASHSLLIQLKNFTVLDVAADSRGNTWFITWGRYFYRYNSISRQLHTYSIADILQSEGRQNILNGAANTILEDNHGTVWIGTTNAGLLRYDAENDSFGYILYQQGNSLGIQYNYQVTTLFQDKEENIWVGTDKGISIFNPYRQYFTILKHEQYNKQSLPKSEVHAFIQTVRGDLLIGTWGGGISVYDKELNFKKTISFADSIPKNETWCFAQNDDGTIWAGCQHGYLHIIDPDKLSLHTIRPPELQRSSIMSMEKDAQGNLWLGLHNGKIVQWNKERKKFLTYDSMYQNDPSARVPLLNIFIDHSQNIWISTWDGLKLFDAGKGVFTAQYRADKKNSGAISSSYSLGIEEYNDNILLVGTQGGGLNFFNKTTKTFTHLTTADGLPANTIYAVKKDTAGYIWFTTDYGLYKFDPADKKFILYNMENNLINSSFISNKFYPLQDGEWLTFTLSETVSFFPYRTEFWPNRQSKTEITGFKLFDKPVFIDSLLFENKPIRLSYKENFFTVEFAVLNFSGSLRSNYYYRLDGIDKDWVNSGTNRFANYTDLQPGEYTFNVKAENGNSSGAITSFRIIITPPFWKTWWFLSACILLVVLTAYLLFRRRVSAIRREAELKHKISETEMTALRAQMNPHFIFNCLNSIDNLIQSGQKEKATTYLAKFAKLIRAILENSKNNVIPCWKDLEALQLYLELEEFRWDKKFSYTLHIATEILQGDYKVPPLVIQPFVENAIHHGLLNKTTADKKLLITVSIENSHIKYVVEDNGIGRKQAAMYKKINTPASTSLGMELTTERIDLFNQKNNGAVTITDLADPEGHPTGTRVEVCLVNQS